VGKFIPSGGKLEAKIGGIEVEPRLLDSSIAIEGRIGVAIVPPIQRGRSLGRWQELQEVCKGEVMVSTEVDVFLRRVAGRKIAEEIEDSGRLRPSVAVVPEEDDGGGVEGGPQSSLQVAP
jgi:type IV secretory pathway protease TraF